LGFNSPSWAARRSRLGEALRLRFAQWGPPWSACAVLVACLSKRSVFEGNCRCRCMGQVLKIFLASGCPTPPLFCAFSFASLSPPSFFPVESFPFPCPPACHLHSFGLCPASHHSVFEDFPSQYWERLDFYGCFFSLYDVGFQYFYVLPSLMGDVTIVSKCGTSGVFCGIAFFKPMEHPWSPYPPSGWTI